MAIQSNPSAKAGENDIIAARREAAAKLLPLFGGKTADGKEVMGVFHTHGIATVFGASPENAKFIDDLRVNPHGKSLAVVAAARGNKNFPAALVAEMFSRPGEAEEDNDWFARVYMGGLAEIFSATGVGLMLPPSQAGLDMVRGAYNVVSHLSPEERKKLALCEADEAPRRKLAVDLLDMLSEEKPAPLTPAQQLYRWALRKWDARQERREARATLTEDVAAALPQATASPEKPAEPEAPKAPAIPDLAILIGRSTPAAPPRTSQTNKKAVAPATTVTDEDQKLILDAIEATGTPAAKAMLALVRAGKKTVAEAAAWATSKGLLL